MRPFERLRARAFRRAPAAPAPREGTRDLAPWALAVLAFVFALWLAALGAAIYGLAR